MGGWLDRCGEGSPHLSTAHGPDGTPWGGARAAFIQVGEGGRGYIGGSRVLGRALGRKPIIGAPGPPHHPSPPTHATPLSFQNSAQNPTRNIVSLLSARQAGLRGISRGNVRLVLDLGWLARARGMGAV